MKKKETIRSLWTPTAGMLSGARRVAMLLVTLLLTMTAQTAWAQEHPLPDPDGEGNVTLDGGEYIVSSNVTISGNITANGPVNLTISSGATLTVGGMGPKQIQMEGGTINVEGGTISGQDCNINVNTFNMNGGSVNVNGLLFHFGTIQNNATIEAYSVNMTGIIDKISITGSTIDSNVINADNVTFSGSDVTVSSTLTLSGPVEFDASSPGVSINVADYYVNEGTLTISNGSLKDADGNIYTGAIANPSALNGKTLTYYNPSSAITVLLNAQGGSGGTTSVTPTADEDMPTITPPTRTGYTFGGYYTETNGGGTKYYDADGTSAHVCELTGTVTLYAKWTANDYTVTLDRQGGSGQESVTATFGSAMPALNPVPSRTDCEFFGYYTETNGGGTKYYNADGTSARTWGIDANTTLYAYWKKSLANADITVEIPAQTYNGSELTPVVTVKDGGAEVSDAHYDIILPEGRTNAGDYTIYIEAKEGSTAYVRVTQATFTINRRTVTLTSATDSKPYDGNALTNDGVTVGGDGFADGEGATYNVTGSQTDAGSSNNTFTYTLNDGTLDANYNITTVEGMLTITKAASSVTAAPTARSLVYDGSEQTLIDAGTASGGTMYYSLDNSTWSTGLPTATEAGEYTVYYKVEGDGNHDNTDAASIKAYIDYTITYDLDGGSVASANPTRYNETTATFTLTNPTRTGYDFTGWTGTGLIYPEMEVTIPEGSAGNRSYTATWETINFEENDITYEWTGSGTNLKIVGYNGTASNLTIPASVVYNSDTYFVTEIGKEAFENNSTLTSIDISSNSNPITIIGARAFKNCTNLSNIEIPAELQSIGSEAFRGCNLTEFTIPETVTSIGQRAFADCPSLTSVTIPETETIWGENPFEGCSENLIIYVPEHLVDTYRSLWPDANILAVGTIPYIAADGSTAYRKYGEYTVLTGSTSTVTLGSDGETTWYVVNSNVDYKQIELVGDVHLILCDDMTMTAVCRSASAIVGSSSNLTIYGQTAGTGTLAAECGEGNGIQSNAITINGGTVNAEGGDYFDISAGGNVIINGGKVSATGNSGGIMAGGDIILGWTNSSDRIYASSFSAGGTISIANGKAFTDGANVYTSATPSATLEALTDVTLIPKKDFTKCKATVPNQIRQYDRMSYQFEAANYGYYSVGETIEDGETTLTLGQDYEFGSIEYADPNKTPSYAQYQGDYDQLGDELVVTINGKGDYSGTLYATFKIIVPDAEGTWNNLKWAYHDGTLTISKKDGEEGNVAMPDGNNYDDFDWKGVASSVFTLTIGEGITNVGNYAFGSNNGVQYYGNLTTINLPSTLTTIGNYAFAYCGGLTIDLSDIPTSVTTIGSNAFGYVDGLTATLTDIESGNALERLSSVFAGYPVEVSFSRSFTANVASTLCLPYDFEPKGGTFYEFTSVNDAWTEVTMTSVNATSTTPLTAGKPYLFMPTADGQVDFTGIITNVANSYTAGTKIVGDWTFTGTYEEKRWDASNNPDGRIFGFATNQGYEGQGPSQNTKAGDFIRLNSGGIKPFRAYLEYTGSLQARTRGEGGLPETMTVRLVNANGEIQGIGEIRLNTGEVTFDSNAWFDLNGRRLDGKPSEKGIYINGGRKVVIK